MANVAHRYVAWAMGIVLVAGVSHGETITWQTTGGTMGATYAGAYVRLYEDVNKDGWGGSFSLGADDLWVNSIEAPVQNVMGTYFVFSSFASATDSGDTGDLSLGDRVYSVVFDSAGTQYQILDVATPFTLPDPEAPADYNLPAGSANPWYPVPEPGTLALFGLGLLTIAARKRIKK